ncbi:MAG: hypothetical protein IPK29_11395 [Betaproteobacteria bacterium]|nr:hypothetical protein [Betaproteobacteria bacterium]
MSFAPPAASKNTAARLAPWLALAALWLLGRRYSGITHDAVLYVAQGLRRLQPEVFARDLFFAWGSQDAYSLFPHLYAPLLAELGTSHAAMLLTIAGQMALFAAAWALAARFARGPTLWWSLALLASVSGYYGGLGVFRIAESFATARTLAEPLVVCALAFTLAARHRSAWAVLGIAALLHPLVAAPGVLAVYLWHAVTRPRLLWALPLVAGLLALLSASGTLPWADPALRFDPEWRAAVRERTAYVFVSAWALPDWSRLAWALTMLVLARPFVAAGSRRLMLAVTLTALAGIACSWVGVDLLGSAAVAGLQPWRAHWLLHLLAILLVPVAVAGLWVGGNAARAAAALLAASCCFGRHELPAAALLAGLALALVARERMQASWMGERLLRLFLIGALAAAAVGLLFALQTQLPATYGIRGTADWQRYLPAALAAGLLPLAALLGACMRAARGMPAIILPAAALIAALALWDARTPWVRFVETAGTQVHAFSGVVPPGAQVYWDAVPAPAWLVLHTPSWFSADQGAGIVFNRATAVEYAARERATHELRSANRGCAAPGDAACRQLAEHARALCARAGGPDFLVLGAPVEGQAQHAWRLPAGVSEGRTLHLHACRG